jgi:hypothetical protein
VVRHGWASTEQRSVQICRNSRLQEDGGSAYYIRHRLIGLRRRIHDIPGGTILHGHYYVDLDKLEQTTNLRAGVTARVRELAQDQLLVDLV